VVPALAHAAAVSPPGVNLRWDRCFADGGVQYRTFACDTNVGVERLVLSFELAALREDVSRIDFLLSLQSASSTLPAWWEFLNGGTCRSSASSLVLVKPSTSPTCTEWGPEDVEGSYFAYGIPGSREARFVGSVIARAPGPVDLVAGVEYYLATINISHAKTVGAGPCAGCTVPVCLSLDHVTLKSGPPGPSLLLNRGANWTGSQVVGWQNGYAFDYRPAQFIDGVFYGASMDCVPYDVTRAAPSTWGAVKSLYR